MLFGAVRNATQNLITKGGLHKMPDKPIIYAEIPEFNQSTQYIIQLEPVEQGDCIYYGVEIKELPPSEEGSVFEY